MFHRLISTVRLAVFGLLTVTAWQPAAAEIYNYEGSMSLCTGICSSFAALGAPTGGVANPTPSEVTGFIEINVAPDGTFTEADIVDYAFSIFNAAAPLEDAVFVGDDFQNPTTANPLPLDNQVVTFEVVPGFPFVGALFGGTGTTGPNNELTSGQLVATFTVPPFNPNGAQIYFDMSGANPTQGYLFGGVVLFTEIDGAFSQLPGEISVPDNPNAFADTAIGETSVLDITVTNNGGGPLTISSVATVDTLAAPFSITNDGCSGTTIASMGNCVIATAFSPTLVGGPLADSFDIISDDPVNASVTVALAGTALEPNLQATPFPLSFVQTSIGEISQALTTVTNTGTADLTINAIDISGLDPVFSVALDNCSMQTLAPAGFCEITMEFAPTAEGLVVSEFIFDSNDSNTPFINYEVEGEGIIGTIAAISVDPTSLTFDEILVGETSELAIQVNSTGNDPLTLNSFALSGADAAEFGQLNDCPATLASGLACTINVTFTPVSGGAKMATLTIDSSANDTPIVDIDISADAFDGPRIVVDPVAVDLGSPSAPVDVGSSATADVTVSNSGNSDLTVGMLSITDLVRGGPISTEFTVDTNGCATPVAPTASCTITVAFSPLTDADKMAELFIPSDDADNPGTFVALTGFVFRGARVDVPQTTVDVDGGTDVEVDQSVNFDLVIGNSGTQDLDITGFLLDGIDVADFSLTSDNCVGTPVVPQGSCTVTITFAPLELGEKSAELSIFSNDVTLVRAATIVVALSATAIPAPVVNVAPPGSQTVPPPSFALADPGGGALGVGLLGLGLILLIARRRYR